jgi:peroxiredoxin Q/BCP
VVARRGQNSFESLFELQVKQEYVMKTQTKKKPTNTKPATSPLGPGRIAPDFELPDDTGTARRLSDFRGKPVVLYFYPADDTPGCTKEACNFRDDYSRYRRHGVTILGVSPDSEHSHERFKSKYNLPFRLLADAEHRVCSLYGVWGRKKFMGRTYDGVLRTTFLIDKAGRIARVFEGVRPAEHSAEVLAEVRDLHRPTLHR